jgi:hypothetical protein
MLIGLENMCSVVIEVYAAAVGVTTKADNGGDQQR